MDVSFTLHPQTQANTHQVLLILSLKVPDYLQSCLLPLQVPQFRLSSFLKCISKMHILSKFHLLKILVGLSIASREESTFLSILCQVLHDLSCLLQLFCVSSCSSLNLLLLSATLKSAEPKYSLVSCLQCFTLAAIHLHPQCSHPLLSSPSSNTLTPSHPQVQTFFEVFLDLAWVWSSRVSKHLVYFPIIVFITLSLHSKHFENKECCFYVPVLLFLGPNKVPGSQYTH